MKISERFIVLRGSREQGAGEEENSKLTNQISQIKN
jgi:hypothetical protein